MSYPILDSISNPDDLRTLSDAQLTQLAAEIRERLIDVTSANGGHVASSLGAVEAILALHLIYDFSHDHLVFDVGHQAYAHKLITGRNGQFDTLRTFGGICGFPRIDESVYDSNDAGHASDSLSTAAGLAFARDLDKSSEKVVAFIGDAALSGGLAFEALNQIGHSGTSLTIVLNDNGMSISKSMGALSLYLAKARMSRPYILMRDGVEGHISRLGRPGRRAVNAGERIKGSVKKLIVPGTFFEDMGIRYIGPIDGHDLKALQEAFKVAYQATGPLLVHIVTQKGHGYAPAEARPDVFHGVGPFDKATGETLKVHDVNKPAFTDVFSQALCREAEADPRIVAITAAMEDGTGLHAFKERFPERFFDVGIAEEHAVALAAGLALGGKLPVVAIYSTFLQRAFDQIVVNVALQQQHVVFCVDRAGLVGEDGPTHHGMLDIAYLRSVPGMRILAPSGAEELQDALHTALALPGPVAVRYARGPVPEPPEGGAAGLAARVPLALPVGQARKRRAGADVAILALGRFVHIALEAAAILEQQGVGAAVWDMRWAKPVCAEAVREAAGARLVVTLEEGVLTGGFGDAVLEELTRVNTTGSCRGEHCSPASSEAQSGANAVPPVLAIGLPDEFVPHGSTDQLMQMLGLTAAQVASQIADALA
jgi:1-deoxy-D-xylulose-5-phosphate synthase